MASFHLIHTQLVPSVIRLIMCQGPWKSVHKQFNKQKSAEKKYQAVVLNLPAWWRSDRGVS